MGYLTVNYNTKRGYFLRPRMSIFSYMINEIWPNSPFYSFRCHIGLATTNTIARVVVTQRQLQTDNSLRFHVQVNFLLYFFLLTYKSLRPKILRNFKVLWRIHWGNKGRFSFKGLRIADGRLHSNGQQQGEWSSTSSRGTEWQQFKIWTNSEPNLKGTNYKKLKLYQFFLECKHFEDKI